MSNYSVSAECTSEREITESEFQIITEIFVKRFLEFQRKQEVENEINI